jgi:hypothetical protein
MIKASPRVVPKTELVDDGAQSAALTLGDVSDYPP